MTLPQGYPVYNYNVFGLAVHEMNVDDIHVDSIRECFGKFDPQKCPFGFVTHITNIYYRTRKSILNENPASLCLKGLLSFTSFLQGLLSRYNPTIR